MATGPSDGAGGGYDLADFRLEDMVRCGASLRVLGPDEGHMEPVAGRVVRHLYDNLRDGRDGSKACALVRVYKTHPFDDLDAELQAVARGILGPTPPAPGMKCLTLLASAGDRPEWNDRRASAGHRAIPLVSREQVEEIPMVSQLIRQFGLETGSLLEADPAFLLDAEQRTFNVFHVIQAVGSPYIPAQAGFVIPCEIASVLGFGGIFPSGDLFAVLLFAKVPIPTGTAEFFKTIALNVKATLLPHDGAGVFEPRRVGARPTAHLAESRIASLTQLLDVQESTALAQTRRLEAKNAELEVAIRQVHDVQQQLVAKERLASLGALTAGIAHEIKNPLNFVTNFAELSVDLLDEMGEELAQHGEPLGPDVLSNLEDLVDNLKQNARKIREHGQRADGIVRTMLLHSRGEAAQRRPTNLNNLVTQYMNLAYHGLRSQDASLNLALEADLDPAIGEILLTPEHFSRVILNLVNNACYAAFEKKKRLGDGFAPAVRVASRDLGPAVEVRIRDNGDGIPEAIRARIFDPFFTTKPPGAGTGLGLSLSHDIVVGEHHGTLKVESLPGEWTEFIITIARIEPEGSAAAGWR